MNKINQAMIFAAGFGKRMLPITKEIPKPLVKVRGKSIISYQIKELIKLKFQNIVVNCHHLPEQIYKELESFSSKVKIIFEKEILDTGGGILNAINLKYFNGFNNPIVLINGDTLWKTKEESPIQNAINNWDKKEMDLLLCLKEKESFFGYIGDGDFSLHKITFKASKIKFCPNNDFVFTGIQILNPKIIKNLEKKKFSMRDIFFSKTNKRIFGILDKSEWFHISNPKDLKKINEIY